MNPLTVSTHLTVRKAAPLAAFLLVFSGIIIWVVLDNPPTAQAATIEKCGDLTSDDTWTSDNIYVVNCDLTVMDSITLTIQAGTVVKFDGHDTDINIDGTLDLQGTASNRVIFTSYKDDFYGGDTNGDDDATSPAPGDWGSIRLRSSANTLDYALIQYGGGPYANGLVHVQDSSPNVENNIIRYSFKNGIYVHNGSPIIKDNTIQDSAEYGLVVSISSPTVTNNTFTDSGTRHFSHSANADPTYSGNTFSGTGGGAIDVTGSLLVNDITWENIQDLDWPYLLLSDLTINAGGTLRLPSGTVIKFRYSTIELIVNGILDVQGTTDDRVVFTSFKDDSHGGDTNGDGAATEPATGDWYAIQINNSANTLDYTLIQYGGYNYGGVYVRDSSPTIEHNLIRHNDNNGIYVYNGSPTIRDNTIADSSQNGLHVFTGSPTVTDNTFTDSGKHHLYHGANADPSYAGNTFSGTGGGAIEIGFGQISNDITWENLQDLGWPYLVPPGLTIASAGTLRIGAGVIVKFDGNGIDLTVSGTLDVQGTADDRVVFTSIKDDSHGGDTNGDGTATMPVAGDWGSIKFYNSPNTLDYALIQYGGGGSTAGAIYIDHSSPSIDHNIIRYNNHGLYAWSGSPIIKDNDITANINYGVFNHNTTSITAVDNWWGHASGPSGVGPGSGDAVSDYVNYTPWLEAPANPITDPPPPSSSILTYLPFVLR